MSINEEKIIIINKNDSDTSNYGSLLTDSVCCLKYFIITLDFIEFRFRAEL